MQLLKSDSNVKIRCIAGSCSLEISEVTIDDDGSYTCKAINSAGVASTKASVQVTGEYCILHPISCESLFQFHHKLGLVLIEP